MATVKPRHYISAASSLPPCLHAPWAALQGRLSLPSPTDGHRTAHHTPPPSSSTSALTTGIPERHSWLLPHVSLCTSGLRRQNFPFHGCGCLFGLIPHFSVSPILRPFCKVLFVCCNQRHSHNNPVTPKELSNSREKIIAAVWATPGERVPNPASGSCCARQCSHLGGEASPYPKNLALRQRGRVQKYMNKRMHQVIASERRHQPPAHPMLCHG